MPSYSFDPAPFERPDNSLSAVNNAIAANTSVRTFPRSSSLTSDVRIPPFIRSHKLFRLNAPWAQREKWMRPAYFGRLKRRDQQEDDAAKRQATGPDEPYAWDEVEDRQEFLTDSDVRLLCVTDDAGMGKTKALEQIQFLRQAADPGHLAILIEFEELPAAIDGFVGRTARDAANTDSPPVLVEKFRQQKGMDAVDPAHVWMLLQRKMRDGRLTLLVDALDQSNQAAAPEEAARTLAGFLNNHPRVRCVVSGRPFAVQHYWKPILNASSGTEGWEVVQLAEFDKDERDAFLGPERAAKLQGLNADFMSVPRSLETILQIPINELGGIRTAADIYWRCAEAMLEAAKEKQRVKISSRQARKLFALLAFEMVRRGILAGVDEGQSGVKDVEFEDFVEDVWLARRKELAGDYDNRDAFDEKLGALGALNVVIDPGVLRIPQGTDPNAPELTQIYWRNRTLQDFFAALWVTRYSKNPEDAEWAAESDSFHRNPELYEFWKMVAEMPVRALKPAVWLMAVGPLFEPRITREAVRSTEMLYRSWPTLLHLAEYRPCENETEIREATLIAQQDARRFAESNNSDTQPAASARSVLLAFLAEFHRIRNGGGEAGRLASELESSFATIPPNASDSFEFWMGDSESEWDDEALHEARLEGSLALSRYAVTNALYCLFDPSHADRFSDYSDYSSSASCPAIYLSWYDAWCVSLWLGGRLPDEYEWEYACRATPGRESPPEQWSCEVESALADHAWYDENSDFTTHPVGTKAANAFGLFDMHGNVLEWTSSWYATSAADGRDPAYVGTSRVLRGGAFNDDASDCRSAYRFYRSPSIAIFITGVRVARAQSENLGT